MPRYNVTFKDRLGGNLIRTVRIGYPEVFNEESIWPVCYDKDKVMEILSSKSAEELRKYNVFKTIEKIEYLKN